MTTIIYKLMKCYLIILIERTYHKSCTLVVCRLLQRHYCPSHHHRWFPTGRCDTAPLYPEWRMSRYQQASRHQRCSLDKIKIYAHSFLKTIFPVGIPLGLIVCFSGVSKAGPSRAGALLKLIPKVPTLLVWPKLGVKHKFACFLYYGLLAKKPKVNLDHISDVLIP